MDSQQIIRFWFEEIDPSLHFKKSDSFDRQIRDRFLETHRSALACELYEWRKEPLGRLAEIIVLDQFSRNLFRNEAKSFMADPMALTLAQEAVYLGADAALSKAERMFLYMPFMHSESAKVHVWAEKLFRELGNENTYKFELKHKVIIDRFGRYPHRNELLGRESTDEEIEFLRGPDSSF